MSRHFFPLVRQSVCEPKASGRNRGGNGKNGKMENGSRYYRALESVSIASALSTAFTIYPCQIRVHQTLTVSNSNFLQLGRRSGRPQRTVYPRRLPVNTVINTMLVGLKPTTFRLLVRLTTIVLPTQPRTLAPAMLEPRGQKYLFAPDPTAGAYSTPQVPYLVDMGLTV